MLVSLILMALVAIACGSYYFPCSALFLAPPLMMNLHLEWDSL